MSKDLDWVIVFNFSTSPGVKAPITPQLASELQEESLGNCGDYVFKRNSDLDDDIKLAKETREREQEGIIFREITV